jgi:tetratricopeptide (TPR) repeat protein
VFPSEFSLAAAEEVLRFTAKEENSAFTRKKAVDLIASLRRRSLLSSSWKDGRTRFRLMLIVRAWAEGFRAHWRMTEPALRGWAGYLVNLAKPLLEVTRASGETRFLNAEREDFAAILRGRVFAEGPWTAAPEDRLVALCALDDWPHGDGLHKRDVAAVVSALEQGAAGELGLLARSRRVHALQLVHLGQWAEAVQLIDETLPRLSQPQLRGLAGELILVKALAYFGWGDQANAFEMSRQAEGILLEVGWYAAAGFARLRIGDVLQSLQRGEEARVIFEQAIAFAEAHEIPFVKARANAALGFYWLERGDHQRSHQAYGQSLSFMTHESNRRFHAILKIYDALVWLDAEAYEQALAVLGELGPQRAQELSPATFRLATALQAMALASLDQLEAASVQRVLAEPRGQLPPWLQHVIRIHLAHVELARARRETRGGNHESAQLTHHATKQMVAEYSRDGELLRTSDDARVALRMLSRALAKQAPALG